jgi:glycosyltransferase involved in cell wall biosynthesis
METDRPLELSLVIPVFNGASSIAATVEAWRSSTAAIGSEIIVVDDGSTDGTEAILDRLAASGELAGVLRVVHQKNAGHGCAVRKGYEQARGEWVFQADSDNEIEPRFFSSLWERRVGGDLVLAERMGRSAGRLRALVTSSEALLMGALGGIPLRDPNVPFRLVRREKIREFCAAARPDEFAPNLLMSLFALRRKWKVAVVKLPHNRSRPTAHSLRGRKLFRGCLAALGGIGRVLFSPRASASRARTSAKT